ncbi:hypothetical protein L6452_09411 [Arctium lappa]|uniref:Uncharacterized protein n=1 Tax=Arctium lappa TaxID=4217 RepID=A0ACB9DJZ2_ARCLA|nr:hypothetical protein L6452_09411 [Arctium lappa]
MDIQDHSKTAGDEGLICHRCGWPFPNSHPSSKHRRAHKRICGTIEGYTKLIESEAISEDEHHSDEDKEKTPSPKIEKGIIKESGNSAGGTEDDLFSDAVTEFSDSGISPGATKLLDSPIEVGKADDNLEVFETPDFYTKDADETEENDINTVHSSSDSQIKLLDSDMKPSDPLVEDGDGFAEDKLIDLVECSNSVNMKPDSANTMDVTSKKVDSFEASDKDQEEQVVYVLSVPSDIPLVDHSETLIDDFTDHKTFYSNVPMILDHDTFEVKTAPVKIQESQASESGKSSIDESAVCENTNTGSATLVPTDVIEEVRVAETKPLEMSKTVPESKDNLIEAKVSVDKRFVATLDERTETASKEINEEKLEFDHEHAPEMVKESEIDDSDPVLTKEDPASERLSEAYTQEIVKEPESGFEAEQKIVGSVEVDSKESGNLGISQRSEKLMADKDEQRPTASGFVSGTLVDEGDGKLLTNQDSVVDASVGSSSRNSLEGNWGSVSVLSTASIDAENAHSIYRSRLGKSDGFQGASLVEVKEEIVDEKGYEMQNSEPKMVNNESEGKKRNEEAIAKVTNWSTGENSTTTTTTTTPLKNVAKSREAKKSNSPPKYIGEGKKVRKKGKGRGSSWVPFGCCSSVNVN